MNSVDRIPATLRNRDGAVVRALASHCCVPGSIPEPGVICGLSLLLVLFSAPRGCSPGIPVFPSTFLPSNSILECTDISETSSCELPGVPWVNLQTNCKSTNDCSLPPGHAIIPKCFIWIKLLLTNSNITKLGSTLNNANETKRFISNQFEFVRQISVAATMIFICHMRRFLAATCRSDLSQSVSRTLRPRTHSNVINRSERVAAQAIYILGHARICLIQR